MIIDMHCHYTPEAVAEALRRRKTAPLVYRSKDGGERRVMPAGNDLPFGRDYTDMNARLTVMDKLAIDRQVLSMGLLFGLHALPAAQALPMARAFNDDLGALCKSHPDRFSGLALLPLADMTEAVTEYRRARTGLGLIGAIVPVNGFIDLTTAGNYEPLFAAAAELGGHIFVHPGVRPDEFSALAGRAEARQGLDNSAARRALDVQSNLAHAMLTLTNTDFLAPYAGVPVHVANLGGTLPIVIERIDRTIAAGEPDKPLPSANLRRVYLDCASLGPRAIELAARVYGADRIMLGSDYPIFDLQGALSSVAAAELDAPSRELIRGGTAEMLIDGHSHVWTPPVTQGEK